MRPDYATEIVRTLLEKGHEAYFVGGCVRDMVMGLEPADFDIATSATPEIIMETFPRTEPVGAQFGVVLVIHRGHPFEVATFRSDDAYVDGRRPTAVTFTSARQDVLRRDFTINGLLWDPIKAELIDYVGGRADIDARIVRAIGNARERFTEDKLRVLRAVRFGARLGYSIEAHTWEAVVAMAPLIHQVSAERIREELFRILTEGPPVVGVQLLAASGLLREILPEAVTDDTAIRALGYLPERPAAEAVMAVLLYRSSPDAVRGVFARLRCSRSESDHAVALVARQHQFRTALSMPVSALKRFLRTERFADHLMIESALSHAEGRSTAAHDFVMERWRQWRESDLFPEPFVNGNDLIELGMTPGPRFRELLTLVEDRQLDGDLPDRESALSFLRARLNQ